MHAWAASAHILCSARKYFPCLPLTYSHPPNLLLAHHFFTLDAGCCNHLSFLYFHCLSESKSVPKKTIIETGSLICYLQWFHSALYNLWTESNILVFITEAKWLKKGKEDQWILEEHLKICAYFLAVRIYTRQGSNI